MEITNVSFRVFWSISKWMIEIDRENGDPPVFLDRSAVLGAINRVRRHRADYRSRAGFDFDLSVFQEASDRLRQAEQSRTAGDEIKPQLLESDARASN